MDKIDLNSITSYSKGEALNSTVLNRPINELYDNISNQKKVIDELVDIINNFNNRISSPVEYITDGSQTEFDIEFYKKLLNVYRDGLLLRSDEYVLNYKDDDDIHGISITFQEAPEDKTCLQLVPIG